MRSNFKLFFYGVYAQLMKLMGMITFLIGVIVLLMNYMTSKTILSYIIGTLILIGGISLGMWGLAMRFDYERKSGSIIHKGDGWN